MSTMLNKKIYDPLAASYMATRHRFPEVSIFIVTSEDIIFNVIAPRTKIWKGALKLSNTEFNEKNFIFSWCHT
jgi:hypothetical protein